MTEEEYKQTEGIALELVDWLFTKSNKNHILLTILMRTLCLFMAQSLRKGTSISAATKEFSKAFEDEMKSAVAFVESQKGKV